MVGFARYRYAALTLATALLTAVYAASLTSSSWLVYAAVLYVVGTGFALSTPSMISVQVVGGQAIAAALLLSAAAPPLALLPLVAGTVATAELLAIVARRATPFPRERHADGRRVLSATVIGAGVFATVAFAAGVSGPSGSLAVVLASAACLALALLLARETPAADVPITPPTPPDS